MRQLIVTLFLAALTFSCSNSGKKEKVAANKEIVTAPLSDSPGHRIADETRNTSADQNSSMVNDTSKIPMPGSDRDEHGCIASAGYTWSVVKNKCIRIWEAGTKLHPTDAVTDKTASTFVVFDKDELKAEVYIPHQPGAVILTYGKKNSEIWFNDDWHLERTGKGLSLKKDDTVLYAETSK